MVALARSLTVLSLTAGLLHVAPKSEDQFDRIHWAPSYRDALTQAAAQHKPLLVVMIAGARDGEC